jgi:hypothetical protein
LVVSWALSRKATTTLPLVLPWRRYLRHIDFIGHVLLPLFRQLGSTESQLLVMKIRR